MIEAADCLLKLCIGKGLGTQLEQNLLLGFQNGPAGMRNAFNGLECGIVAACVHIHLYQVAAYFIGVCGVGKLIQEVLEYRNRLAESRVGCFVNAESVIVGCLFLYFQIGIGCGGLFKCHTRLVLVGKLQVSQSHVQICVLRKRIFVCSHLAQGNRNLRVDTRPVVGHSQHIKRISSWGRLRVVFQIAAESFYCFMVLAEMIIGCTLYAVHLSRIFLVGVSREIVLRNNFRFVIILFNQIYFRDVIRYKRLVFCIVLQAEEAAEGIVVPLL